LKRSRRPEEFATDSSHDEALETDDTVRVDEDFNNDIVRGLVRRIADLDILTQDVSTLIALAFERVRSAKPMAGVIAVSQSLPIRVAIEDLVLVAECGSTEEWANQVLFLPLR
jgi:hypothetical protein